MRGSLFTLACLVLCSGVAHGATTLVLTGDLGYASCPTVPTGVLTRMYVVASLPEQACGGITGAEFRVVGFPTQGEGWIVIPAWPPGVQPAGDPFAEGVRLAFPCAAPENGVVVLFAFDVLPTTFIVDRTVSVAAHQIPSLPESACPVVTLCDASSTQICVNGSETRLNDTIGFCYCSDGCPFPGCPPVAADPGTWSKMKELYRQ